MSTTYVSDRFSHVISGQDSGVPEPEFDLYIEIDGNNTEWQAHKAVVCHESADFAYACGLRTDKPLRYDSPVLEFVRSPGRTDQLILESFEEPDVVNCLLEFMYEQDYDVPDDMRNELLFHSKVFYMGYRYGVPALQGLAVRKFDEEFEEQLLDLTTANPFTFLRAIVNAYQTPFDCSRALRNCIVRNAVPYTDWFFDDLWTYDEYQDQCRTFMYELTRALGRRVRELEGR